MLSDYFLIEKIYTFHFYLFSNNIYNKLKYFFIEACNFLNQKIKSSILLFSEKNIYMAFPSVSFLDYCNKFLTKKIPYIKFITLDELIEKIREISDYEKHIRIGIDSESEALKNENISQVTNFKNFLKKNFFLENIRIFLHDFSDKFTQKSLIWNLIATDSIFFLQKKKIGSKIFIFI